MPLSRPYFNTQEFAVSLFAAMHRVGCDSPERLADLITNVTGYAVEPSTIQDILDADDSTPVSFPLFIALLETLEPLGGYHHFTTAFRPETVAHLEELRRQREVNGRAIA